ncbi:hypothetical protein NKG05_17520 [Oerskovia sp. M15]
MTGAPPGRVLARHRQRSRGRGVRRGWIATDRTDAGAALVVTCAATLAVSSAVSALPLSGWWGSIVTVAAAVAAGGALGAVLPEVETTNGLWTGAVAGMLVAALHALFDQLPALERRAASVAAIVLPVTVGDPGVRGGPGAGELTGSHLVSRTTYDGKVEPWSGASRYCSRSWA